MAYSDNVIILPLKDATPQDYGPDSRVITVAGNAAVSAARSKYYGSSWLFDGSGDYLSVGSPRFVLSGGFEIECWAYLSSLSAVAGLIYVGTYGADNSRIQLYVNTDGSVSLFSNTSAGDTVFWATSAAGVVSTGSFLHFLGWRNGANVGIAVNGAQVASGTASGTVGTSTTCLAGYARTGGTHRYLHGHLNDMRVIAGDATRTGSFTPPERLVAPISGVVTDDSVAVARTIFAVPREYPIRLWNTVSDSGDGSYELWVPSDVDVSRIVCADDSDPLRNDIVDRIIAA